MGDYTHIDKHLGIGRPPKTDFERAQAFFASLGLKPELLKHKDGTKYLDFFDRECDVSASFVFAEDGSFVELYQC